MMRYLWPLAAFGLAAGAATANADSGYDAYRACVQETSYRLDVAPGSVRIWGTRPYAGERAFHMDFGADGRRGGCDAGDGRVIHWYLDDQGGGGSQMGGGDDLEGRAVHRCRETTAERLNIPRGEVDELDPELDAFDDNLVHVRWRTTGDLDGRCSYEYGRVTYWRVNQGGYTPPAWGPGPSLPPGVAGPNRHDDRRCYRAIADFTGVSPRGIVFTNVDDHGSGHYTYHWSDIRNASGRCVVRDGDVTNVSYD